VGFFVLKPNLNSSEISYVADDSPATVFGLEPGDIIVEIEGQSVNSWTDLSTIMSNHDSTLLSLSYTRGGITYDKEDISIAVMIQTAGLTNQKADGTRYDIDPIIGQATGRAKTDGELQEGDLITKLQVGTHIVTVTTWDDVIAFFKNNNRGEVTITYVRDSQTRETSYELISERALSKLGYQPIVFQIGISPTSSFDLGYSLLYPFKSVGSNVSQVLNTLGLLFDRSENLGIGDLSGPVGIFSLVSQTTSQGLLSILSFTAFLSINIGLLNLMPIPALDGGRLVFLGVEAITRKPLNRKIENTINNVMFFILIGLFVFVTYNDIIRLIKG
jgi:regulator of sigma E protease